MRYLPAQAKEALSVSEETFRHWRKALPPLRGKRGYSPCFTPGDLLALKVVAKLHDLGLQVGQLVPVSEALFSACCETPWFALQNKVLVLSGESLELRSLGEGHEWMQMARIEVPLGPLIKQLNQSLSGEIARPAQPEISFPPLGVAQGSRK